MNGDVLHKVDRATMSVGLEARIPFLNSEVYEFSKNLSQKLKFKNGLGKWILEKNVRKIFP